MIDRQIDQIDQVQIDRQIDRQMIDRQMIDRQIDYTRIFPPQQTHTYRPTDIYLHLSSLKTTKNELHLGPIVFKLK